MICQSIFLHKFEAFGKDQDERYQAWSYGQLRVSKSRQNILNSIVWYIGLSVFGSKKKIDNIPIDNASTTKKLLSEPLIEKEPVVIDEKWGWVWKIRKMRRFLDISDYQDSDATNKINANSAS